MATEQAPDYQGAVRLLWPEGADPSWGGPPAVDSSERPVWHAVPGKDHVRLLVPAGHPRAASAALRRYSDALDRGERGRRLVVASAAQLGMLQLHPHRISGPVLRGSLQEELGRRFGRDVVVSLSLGTNRTNSKPVLGIFGVDGQQLAFAKVGTTPVGARLVRHETESLRSLEGREQPAGLVIPRVVDSFSWQGLPVLCLQVLGGNAVLRPRPGSRSLLWRLMDEFARAGGDSRELPLRMAPAWDRLGGALWAGEPALVAMLDRAQERFAAAAGDTCLEVGRWHGDWTPWNMGWRDATALVWDWERFETGVPVGMDRCHYALSRVFQRHGVTMDAVAAGFRDAGVGELDRLLPGTAAYALTGSYLATVARRYLASDERPPTETLDRVRVLVWALDRLSTPPAVRR